MQRWPDTKFTEIVVLFHADLKFNQSFLCQGFEFLVIQTDNAKN